MFKKNQELKDLRVIDYTHEGFGVVKVETFPIFVKYAKLNDVVDIKITKAEKKFAYGIITSENKCVADCEYYTRCGGCNVMHLDYDEQLKFKKSMLRNTLSKFKLEVKIHDVVASDQPFGYRNKVLMPFTKVNDEIKLGFYKEKSHNVEVVNNCIIQSPLANKIFNFTAKLLTELDETVYNEDKHQGNLRHLYIRESQKNEEVMVCFVLNGSKLKSQSYVVDCLTREFPQIKSIVINENKRKTNAVLGYKNINIYNCNFIEETILGNTYRLLPNAFFQVNTAQTEKLYTEVLKACDLKEDDTVLDAFCGVGSITLSLAARAKHVTGIEIVEQAIKSANLNAEANNITNTTFICNDVEKEIIKYEGSKKFFDVVVVDPPRKGLEDNMIEILKDFRPNRVVYVSCSPSSLGRDLQKLSEVYKVDYVTPVDMFSQTSHVECVVKLSKK